MQSKIHHALQFNHAKVNWSHYQLRIGTPESMQLKFCQLNLQTVSMEQNIIMKGP